MEERRWDGRCNGGGIFATCKRGHKRLRSHFATRETERGEEGERERGGEGERAHEIRTANEVRKVKRGSVRATTTTTTVMPQAGAGQVIKRRRKKCPRRLRCGPPAAHTRPHGAPLFVFPPSVGHAGHSQKWNDSLILTLRRELVREI